MAKFTAASGSQNDCCCPANNGDAATRSQSSTADSPIRPVFKAPPANIKYVIKAAPEDCQVVWLKAPPTLPPAPAPPKKAGPPKFKAFPKMKEQSTPDPAGPPKFKAAPKPPVRITPAKRERAEENDPGHDVHAQPLLPFAQGHCHHALDHAFGKAAAPLRHDLDHEHTVESVDSWTEEPEWTEELAEFLEWQRNWTEELV